MLFILGLCKLKFTSTTSAAFIFHWNTLTDTFLSYTFKRRKQRTLIMKLESLTEN